MSPNYTLVCFIDQNSNCYYRSCVKSEKVREIQGSGIPFCFGSFSIDKTYFYKEKLIKHFLLLQYGGEEIPKEKLAEVLGSSQLRECLSRLEQAGFPHEDLSERNILELRVIRILCH